jgi:glycosyltransferase involved in cell wall biosynthesis
VVPEPFGDLHPDFRASLDHIEIVRRGLETRTGYIRRLVQRVLALKPDVIINNAVPMVQAALPLLPHGVVRISVVHNLLENEVKLGLANGVWIDWVVAVSDNIREMLERRNGQHVPLATIPVGLEMPSTERRQQKAAKPLRLIYVGRIEAQKNLPALLNVLSSLYRASVPFFMTIVGTGRELQSVRSRVASSPYRTQVEFLGARNQREVARLLEENDFLLLTSHFEGTPHAILEAMAHGLVVLASRILGSTDRIITHGMDGFLCDKDAPEDYVAVLRRVSSSPTEFAAVSGAARRTVSSRYSADALAARYESLFSAGRVSRRATMEPDGQIQVPRDVLLDFPGIILQGKHRAADFWRQVVGGMRPVSPEELKPTTVF